jgi:hypothetical protein
MDRLSRQHAPAPVAGNTAAAVSAPAGLSAEERAVLQAIRNTPFGAIEVVLHQSRIVQIVKTEKVRVEGTALTA